MAGNKVSIMTILLAFPLLFSSCRKTEVDYSICFVNPPTEVRLNQKITFEHGVENVGSTLAPKGGYAVYLSIQQQGQGIQSRKLLDSSGQKLSPGGRATYSGTSSYFNWMPTDPGLYDVQIECIPNSSVIDKTLSNNSQSIVVKVIP